MCYINKVDLTWKFLESLLRRWPRYLILHRPWRHWGSRRSSVSTLRIQKILSVFWYQDTTICGCNGVENSSLGWKQPSRLKPMSFVETELGSGIVTSQSKPHVLFKSREILWPASWEVLSEEYGNMCGCCCCCCSSAGSHSVLVTLKSGNHVCMLSIKTTPPQNLGLVFHQACDLSTFPGRRVSPGQDMDTYSCYSQG